MNQLNRLLIFGLIALGLAVLGLATLNGALIALAIVPAIYIGEALLDAPAPPKLQITRALSVDRVAPGEPVTVSLTVTNAGDRAVQARISDTPPAGLELAEGQPTLLAALAPGASAKLEYAIRGARGFHHFGKVLITTTDILGIVQIDSEIETPGKILILPEVVRLTRLGLRPRRTRVYSGTIPARQGGPGVEFFGVREYQPGDPVRWINERVSARFPGALYVNEFEQERVADIGIILDARRSSDVQGREHTLFEYGVQAAAALGDAMIGQGNRVGMLIYGNAIEWTLPGYGKRQRERLMRALANTRTGDRAALASLDDIPTRLFPIRSQIVLISPLQPDDAQAVVRLRAHSYDVLVVSPDPVAFELATMGNQATLAARIARVERTALLRRLTYAGARVVDWPVETSLALAVSAALMGRSS